MSAIKDYEEFWLGLNMSDAKLKLFRFGFFFVFALDAWLQIGNAPRYGFGDFNVSHAPFLDGILPMPTRAAMSVVYGAQVLLGLRIALGGASRVSYIALASLFAGGYFISQLNSYQHHYLLALALALLAAFPWPDLPGQKENPSKERFWPVRMLLVALSVMYIFAMIAKLDGEWLDGSTMQRQITEGWIRDLVEDVGWGTAAKLTVVAELLLAILIHVRKLWPLAIVIGVGMHMVFEFSGLRIGLFSYFMATLYLLFLPEAWIAKAKQWLAPLHNKAEALRLKVRISKLVGLGIFAATTAAAATLTQSIFIDSVNLLTWCVVVFAIADAALTKTPTSAGIKMLIACLGLLAFVHTTDGLRTYYHFWGHNDRRNKDMASAIIHYENVVAIDPGYASGHSRLAASYLRMGRNDDALRQYEAGLVHNPKHFNLNRGAAQLYSRAGKGPEALAAAKRALAAKPRDQVANQIRKRWEQSLGTDAQN